METPTESTALSAHLLSPVVNRGYFAASFLTHWDL